MHLSINTKSYFNSINKVILISLVSLWISMLIVFNEYLQPKFAVKFFIIHSIGIIATASLLNILFKLRTKSLLWKVEGVIFTYFFLYFFITKAYLFLKYNGSYFRGNRTDYVELMTFLITILFSILIIASFALKTKLKK